MSNPWNNDQPWQPANIWIACEQITSHMAAQLGYPVGHWVELACNRYVWPALPKWTEKRNHAVRPWQYRNVKPSRDYRCLILGSTEGGVETVLWEWGFDGEMVVMDIAEKAMARQQEAVDKAGRERVYFRAADLNTATLDGPYDFIIANGILHHLIGLKHCLSQIRAALTDDGVVIANEFTGPYRFQLPPEQVRWINAVAAFAPSTARISAHDYKPPTDEQMIAMDPSEAIAGHLLDDAFTDVFEVFHKSNLGGTITTYLHEQIDYRLIAVNPANREWIDAALKLEKKLIDTGVINCDYTFYVGRKPANTNFIRKVRQRFSTTPRDGRAKIWADSPFASHPGIPLNFDPRRYLDRNRDVLQAGVDPYEHYVRYGKAEGRLWAASPEARGKPARRPPRRPLAR
jgi:SAM-dependent methyltransferase